MTLGIFIYGTFVFTMVAVALGLLAWGIVNERRDRMRFEQGREVFGEATAAMHAHGKQGGATP
jgi:hypothetical protein